MTKTSKTSITAIVFVTIYFLFIIFIALFKGLTLYNLHFNNLKIEKFYIKLNKKITLKIDKIHILSSTLSSKEAIKLHKIFYYMTKILPLFQEISINQIYKNNKLLIKQFDLNKNKFCLKTPIFYTYGKFKIYKNYSSVFLNFFKYKNYIFKNTSIFSYYTKNYLLSNIKTNYLNNSIYFAIKANNSFINYSIYSKKFKFHIKDNLISTTKFYINGKINTYFTYYTAHIKTKKMSLKNNNAFLYAKTIQGNLKNNILNINANISDIKYKNFINNLLIKNLFLSFDIKNRSLMSSANKITLTYKKYKINAKNITFNYYLNNKNFFLHANHIKFNNDIKAFSKEIVLSKLPNFYFFLNRNHITYKFFNLKNKIIKGDKRLVVLSDIIGKFLDYNISIKSPKIYIKRKYAFSKKIVFNNIKFNNTKFNFIKKPYILSSTTSTLLNKNIISILNKYKINLPLIQITGHNLLHFNIFFNKKLQNILYDFNSSNSIYKYNNLNIFYKKLSAKGDLNFSKIKIKDLSIPYKYFNANLDVNTTINLKQKYINSFAFIHKLNIENYLNIKNLHEKIVFDLKRKFLFLLNSAIFANLNNNTIYFYSLKNLLKYSLFNKIFRDGEIIIKLLKNQINIKTNTIMKYPLILNQKNPYKLNANILIKKNNIYIENKYINSKIINLTDIYTYIHNLNIDIEGLIKIVNTVKNIIKQTKTKNTNQPIKAVITSKNTNFIYKNHKFLTNEANLIFDKEIKFNAKYYKSILHGYTKNGYLLIEGKNYNKKTLVPLLNFFNHFTYINLDFILVKSPENFYTGKIYIKNGAIKDLAALNNIIAFINTIPALLTLNNPGFSAKGYKIKNGYINYLFYKNILYFKQIKIKGENLDLYGKGYVNLNKNYIKMKIQAVIKIKLKKIPILGKALSYILFGKDGYLHVNIFVKGDLNNPKISKDMGGGIIESPLKLFKRILTLPFNIF